MAHERVMPQLIFSIFKFAIFNIEKFWEALAPQNSIQF